ncbi:hypothetical protein KEM48_007698 [Puccinia striiformis f. sp. tritici PST-130]|nr:hypothetical protein KEM48_007698 [Puccinia striiformis f. sp. tritici PST-130]
MAPWKRILYPSNAMLATLKFESPGRQPEFSFVMVHQKKLCYWPNVNILADMQELLQAAGISLQPRQVTFKRFNVTYDFSEFPPSPTRSVEMDPDDLCCFCDEILPKNPSAAFLKANKKLRALPEVRARNKSKNPQRCICLFLKEPSIVNYTKQSSPPYLMELIEDGPRRLTLVNSSDDFSTSIPSASDKP